jgi:hypothetical protein
LREILDQKLAGWNSLDEKMRKKRITQIVPRKEFCFAEHKKNEELRKLMNLYYAQPNVYTTRRKETQHGQVPAHHKSLSLTSEAEDGLEESLRDFYRSKAVENRKLKDILDNISMDRPFLIREKVSLIQEDHEKYKNKHHSIEKFNLFREKIEGIRRARQLKNFTQALMYLEILDDFKRKRHEPSDSELLLLELWRRIIESGCVITRVETREMTSILSEEELSAKPLQALLEKLLVISSG